MRNVRRAMDFEFGRQVEVISNGGRIIQSTLNFDADKGTTSPMRTKEEANDYRYFLILIYSLFIFQMIGWQKLNH